MPSPLPHNLNCHKSVWSFSFRKMLWINLYKKIYSTFKKIVIYLFFNKIYQFLILKFDKASSYILLWSIGPKNYALEESWVFQYQQLNCSVPVSSKREKKKKIFERTWVLPITKMRMLTNVLNALRTFLRESRKEKFYEEMIYLLFEKVKYLIFQ